MPLSVRSLLSKAATVFARRKPADVAAEATRREIAARRYADARRIQAMINHMLVPHHEQFASRYAAGAGDIYWSRFDEALRDNWYNALVLRRSEFVHELLRHRQMPTVSLPWRIETDDPKDPDQIAIAERMTKMLNAIPRYQAMRLYLLECLWYGKYAAQIQWGTVMIDGEPCVTIVDHEPVDGDSIVYKHDKTPGILVRAGWSFGNPYDDRYVDVAPQQSWMASTDRARALFLYDQFWRDHFIIANFEPSSADYLFEGEKAAGIFGVGLRSRLYFAMQLRDEIRSWRTDAMQRIGANGMIYGFYPSGNDAAMMAILESLQLLLRDNVTAFPVEEGAAPQKLEHIEPSNVGYEEMDKWVTELEDCMRRIVVGQSLSSQAESTGLGSEVAELHRTTREQFIRYDSINEQEYLTRDMLQPMIRLNVWKYRGQEFKGYLPFQARIVNQVDKANVKERSDVYFGCIDRGIKMSADQFYEDLGVSPPQDQDDVLQAAPEKQGEGGGGADGLPGMGGEPGKNGHAGNGRMNGHAADGHAAGIPGMPGMEAAGGDGAALEAPGGGETGGEAGGEADVPDHEMESHASEVHGKLHTDDELAAHAAEVRGARPSKTSVAMSPERMRRLRAGLKRRLSGARGR